MEQKNLSKLFKNGLKLEKKTFFRKTKIFARIFRKKTTILVDASIANSEEFDGMKILSVQFLLIVQLTNFMSRTLMLKEYFSFSIWEENNKVRVCHKWESKRLISKKNERVAADSITSSNIYLRSGFSASLWTLNNWTHLFSEKEITHSTKRSKKENVTWISIITFWAKPSKMLSELIQRRQEASKLLQFKKLFFLALTCADEEKRHFDKSLLWRQKHPQSWAKKSWKPRIQICRIMHTYFNDKCLEFFTFSVVINFLIDLLNSTHNKVNISIQRILQFLIRAGVIFRGSNWELLTIKRGFLWSRGPKNSRDFQFLLVPNLEFTRVSAKIRWDRTACDFDYQIK